MLNLSRIRRNGAQPAYLAALVLALAGTALAQSAGGDFAITREVVAGGGGRATGGSFIATTTTAQPVAALSSGGDFVLSGGFQVPAGPAPPLGPDIFRDGFEGP